MGDIAEFFGGKHVFITGASGFLGKLLLEKLLRSCPKVKNAYILLRSKKGINATERAEKLFSDVVFSKLREEQPDFEKKVVIIEGDVALPKLGISADDWSTLTQNVNVICHIAATVRLDEVLKMAILTNVRGTRDILTLAKECSHLASFLHVSTAYANVQQYEVKEDFYDCPYTTQELIDMAENIADDELTNRTQEIIGNWPNTYAFSKAIAERTVEKYGGEFPTCIVRPAIVISTYKEPLRNWIDNIYGYTGVIVGAGTGVMKTVHCQGDRLAELVPADYVVNCFLAATCKVAMEKPSSIPIYNFVSSPENAIDWNTIMYLTQKYGLDYPPIRAIWCYSLTLNKNYYVHMLYVYFLHLFPAMLMDLAALVTGQKPIMLNIYKKIHKFNDVISNFSTKQWHFYNDNTQKLWLSLGEADRKIFPFSMKLLDWDDYSRMHGLGLRQYILKDDPSTLPQARVRWRRFQIATILIKFFTVLFIFTCFYWFLHLFNLM